MSHALESFLSLDILLMLSIGSKFPKFWIRSFWLILRFWVRFKTGIGFGRSKTLYKLFTLILWNLNILIEVLDCIIFQLIIIEGLKPFSWRNKLYITWISSLFIYPTEQPGFIRPRFLWSKGDLLIQVWLYL
jgi:hypothetical protein